MEVVPGIHRIESDLGPRSMAQFLLRGQERTLLVDTGLATTPETAILPYLGSIGVAEAGPDTVLISHADVDHCGGNAAIRRAFPRALFAGHRLDRAWIERAASMMDGNYLWYREFGFGPDAATVTWIEEQLAGDIDLDLVVCGGETFRLDHELEVDVLHLPGHTAGHIGLWDARGGTAIIVDAILERGVRDRAGTLLIPPRIYDLAAYRQTIARVQALDADVLLTAHFPVMRGAEVQSFLARSLAFVDALEEAVDDARGQGLTDLWDVTRFVDRRLGPYPEFMIELAAGVNCRLGAANAA
jgi:glyoxylase-like metal-dependent hydrolase (beta-lactamase superfamily II)